MAVVGIVAFGIQQRNATFDEARALSNAMFAGQDQLDATAEYFGTKTWSQELAEMDGSAERERIQEEAAEYTDLAMAIQDPGTPPDVLAVIIADAVYERDYNLLSLAARNADLPPELLDRIYRSANRLEGREALLVALVRNPNTSDDTLRLLANHDGGKSRVAREAKGRLGITTDSG